MPPETFIFNLHALELDDQLTLLASPTCSKLISLDRTIACVTDLSLTTVRLNKEGPDMYLLDVTVS
jgi:hypothetical protein